MRTFTSSAPKPMCVIPLSTPSSICGAAPSEVFFIIKIVVFVFQLFIVKRFAEILVVIIAVRQVEEAVGVGLVGRVLLFLIG